MDRVRFPSCSSCPQFRAETPSLSSSFGTGHLWRYRTGTNPSTALTLGMTLPILSFPGSPGGLRQGQPSSAHTTTAPHPQGRVFLVLQSLAVGDLSSNRPCTPLGTTWTHRRAGLCPHCRTPLPMSGSAGNRTSLGSYMGRKITSTKPRKAQPQHGSKALLCPGPRQWTAGWSPSTHNRAFT